MNVRDRGRRRVAGVTAGLAALATVGAGGVGVLARNETVAKRQDALTSTTAAVTQPTTSATPTPSTSAAASPAATASPSASPTVTPATTTPTTSAPTSAAQAPAATSGGS